MTLACQAVSIWGIGLHTHTTYIALGSHKIEMSLKIGRVDETSAMVGFDGALVNPDPVKIFLGQKLGMVSN